MSSDAVTVVEVETVIAVAAHQPVVTVTTPGPQGVAGPAGPPGPTGGEGFTHAQTTPAATWPINHNLGRYPHVTVVDLAGNKRLSDVIYSDIDNVSVIHSEPLAGAAYFS